MSWPPVDVERRPGTEGRALRGEGESRARLTRWPTGRAQPRGARGDPERDRRGPAAGARWPGSPREWKRSWPFSSPGPAGGQWMGLAQLPVGHSKLRATLVGVFVVLLVVALW